ncbi:MAG TPA: EAL domain-containing protein [Spirochaetia bacterium]|nr:EAL domain-containing protein [Spirochaetia bacterium]
MTDDSKPWAENAIQRLEAERDAALRAAQTAVYDTTRLTRLLTIISEPSPLAQLVDRLLALLSELFSADIVVLLDPAESGSFAPLAAIGLPEESLHTRMSTESDANLAAALRSMRPVLHQLVATDPDAAPVLRDLGVETAVWIPVIGSHDAAQAVLILARCRPVPFLNTDVGLLTAMTYRIGLALEQAQRRSQLEQVIHAGDEMSRHLDESALSAEAVRMFRTISKADATALVSDTGTGALASTANAGLDPRQACAFVPLTEELLHGHFSTEAGPYTTNDARKAADVHATSLPDDVPVRALAAIPVFRGGKVHGLLYALRFSTLSFSPDALQIASLFAGQLSSALENARLYRSARDELAERKRAELALRASDERFRALIRGVTDVIAILSVEGIILYANPAVETAWSSPVDEVCGQNILDLIHSDDVQAVRDLLSSAQPTATRKRPVRVRQGKDSWRDFEVTLTNLLTEQAVSGIVATFHDVTERKTYERELTKLAYLDPLTGLANRSHFKDKLQRALDKANAAGTSVAVFFLDVDNFKILNDSMGHEAGDRVLKLVAERLQACLRRGDEAARMGGDEFTLFIEGVTSIDQVLPVARRITASLNGPVKLDSRDLFIGTSMGIAVSVLDKDSIDDLLRKADLAMYRAKNTEKGSFAFYDTQLNAVATERLEIETGLRRALARHELVVHYQPIISLDDRHVSDVEALVRWRHPRLGLMPPAKFIPIAEETGLIIEIGQWVLEEACRQVGIWQRRFAQNLSLSVNLSARQFRHVAIVNEVTEALRKSGLNPGSLTLEITESVLVHDPVETIGQLQALKRLGIRLAIDDFGIGYSSLSYLKQFPVDILKIDRTFVNGVDSDTHDKAIARSVIALADAFDLTVTAEGIETEAQAFQLLEMGCHRGQGYLFSKPMPADQCESSLAKELGDERRRAISARDAAAH